MDESTHVINSLLIGVIHLGVLCVPLTCTPVFNHSDVIDNHSDKGGTVDIGIALVMAAQITAMEPNHNQLVVVLPQNRTT